MIEVSVGYTDGHAVSGSIVRHTFYLLSRANQAPLEDRDWRA